MRERNVRRPILATGLLALGGGHRRGAAGARAVRDPARPRRDAGQAGGGGDDGGDVRHRPAARGRPQPRRAVPADGRGGHLRRPPRSTRWWRAASSRAATRYPPTPPAATSTAAAVSASWRPSRATSGTPRAPCRRWGVPGNPASEGLQFLICVVAQPGLDGAHTIWGRVAEGLPVVTRISETPVDAQGGRRPSGSRSCRCPSATGGRRPRRRSRPRPSTSSPGYRAVLETSAGPITLELFPDRAPGHVRNFLRLSQAGGLRRHGVPPRRPGVRHPDRLRAEPRHAADRGAAEPDRQPRARVQRHART